jgi:hypothetical protein
MRRRHASDADVAVADAAALPPPYSLRTRQKQNKRHALHRIRTAKRAARSELSVTCGEWGKHGFAASPSLLSTDGIVDDVPRVHASVRCCLLLSSSMVFLFWFS